jgi:hypothetical protein
MCAAAAVRLLGLASPRARRAEELDALELVGADIRAKESALLVHFTQEAEAGVSESLVSQAQESLGLFIGHRVPFRIEIFRGGGVFVSSVISNHRIERVRRHDGRRVSAGHRAHERAGVIV